MKYLDQCFANDVPRKHVYLLSSLRVCGLVFLDAFTKLQKPTISVLMSLCPSAWNNLAPTGQIFMKFSIWVFFENLSGKFKFD